MSKKVKRLPPGTPNPVDVHVGGRVRMRRTLLGISQEKLGEAIGLTFQQVQKYERGTNRISASRLFELSQILDVPVSYFYEELPDELTTAQGRFKRGIEDAKRGDFEVDPMARRETLELMRAYYRIKDSKVRARLMELIRTLSKSAEAND